MIASLSISGQYIFGGLHRKSYKIKPLHGPSWLWAISALDCNSTKSWWRPLRQWFSNQVLWGMPYLLVFIIFIFVFLFIGKVKNSINGKSNYNEGWYVLWMYQNNELNPSLHRDPLKTSNLAVKNLTSSLKPPNCHISDRMRFSGSPLKEGEQETWRKAKTCKLSIKPSILSNISFGALVFLSIT